MKHLTLKEARGEMTQQELAAKSGVPQQTISKIENAADIDPKNTTVTALEKALNLKRGTLIFGAQERVAS